MTIISRSCLIAADSLAICTTWCALGQPHDIGDRRLLRGSISGVLLVDGEQSSHCFDFPSGP